MIYHKDIKKCSHIDEHYCLECASEYIIKEYGVEE